MLSKKIITSLLVAATLGFAGTTSVYAETNTSTNTASQTTESAKLVPELFLEGYTAVRTNVLDTENGKVYSGLFNNGVIQAVLIRESAEVVPMRTYSIDSLSITAPQSMSADTINQVLKQYGLSQRVEN
ncbi:hypothetical protein CJP74_04295 [Psittacicella melopsittaci]|uniref:Uncharacterized protein n=1 Tax=Psittacicella melopsittaci TaxID=2028576 RepID=A0A3A1Y2U2_9GAMM|nr:hypothetical protein [Psittacicella melopsittaci]RIY32543.1 hypothetical protein CJP74_04295 [Psittacicella melopsittaci]